MQLPFGDAKWEEGKPAQDMVSLGIGFDMTDTTAPRCYIPPASVKEVVYLMERYVTQDKMLLKEAESLASKLLRMSMVVENGRLYICGLFALSSVAAGGEAASLR
jgi:hypothetical protein